jgi:oligopeptide transport system substrate-binding protein
VTSRESSAHRRARLAAQRLVADLQHGRLSRRDFTRRAVALGFSGAAINLFLIGCSVGPFGKSNAIATQSVSPSASAAASAAPSAAASGSAAPSAVASPSPGASAAPQSARPGPATPSAAPATPVPATPLPTAPPSPIATAQGTLLGGPVPTNPSLADRQVLNYPFQEPNTADPGLMTALLEVQFAVACWDGLIRLDQGGEPQPAHATKYDIAPDGLKYTFTLRNDLKWSDGSPLTAKDYEWTWKRNLSPELASEYAQALYPIKGARDYHLGANADSNSVQVQATNDTALEVTLDAPAPHFLALVSTWPCFPLRQATIEANKEGWTEAGKMVTAGRFKLQTWDHEKQMVLVRDQNYYGEKPTLEQVTLRIYKDLAAESLAAYEKGEIDVTPVLQPEGLSRAKADPKLKVELQLIPVSGTGFLVFDTTNAQSPVSKKEFRQAAYQAINRERLCNTVLQGQFVPATTLVPKGIQGYLAQPPTPVNPQGDAAKARQLLQTAGYANEEIVFTHSDQPRAVAIAQSIQQDVKAAGINMRLEALDRRTYATWRQARLNQPFGCYFGSWFSDYEDPENWYGRFFADPNDEYWYTHYTQLPGSAQFNGLLASAGKEPDRQKRGALYVQIETMLLQDLPLAPVYGFQDAILVKPYVKGLVHTATGLDLFGGVKLIKV